MEYEVEFSKRHPEGLIICELCLKKVPWPSYTSHVSDCWQTPPPVPA